jgi:hypothetical protein
MSCVCKCNTLAFRYPELVKEISPLANVDVRKITIHTNQKLLWLCSNVPNGICPECHTIHSWSARVSGRVAGHGCPFCSNTSMEICKCKSLAWRRPDLCRELIDQDTHDPWKLKTGSNQRVKWQCSAFPDGKCTVCGTLHVWEASVTNRANRGLGCPFCATHKDHLCRCRTLGWKNPSLARELVDADPWQISAKSSVKCKWQCSKNPGGICPECQTHHVWEASVLHRTAKGCPWCSRTGTVVCKCKSLGWRFPDIAKELVDANPFKVSYGSAKVCTWRCPKGHTYKAPPNSRTNQQKSGCPICRANKGEAILRDVLDNHPDVESHHKKALECFDKYTNRTRMLVPDACVYLMSGALVAIELDGPQHFGPVTWYGESTDFVDQMRRDIAKNTTLQHLGYSILRIAYSEYNQIPFHVNAFISDVLRSDRPVMQRTPEETYQVLERMIENLL